MKLRLAQCSMLDAQFLMLYARCSVKLKDLPCCSAYSINRSEKVHVAEALRCVLSFVFIFKCNWPKLKLKSAFTSSTFYIEECCQLAGKSGFWMHRTEVITIIMITFIMIMIMIMMRWSNVAWPHACLGSQPGCLNRRLSLSWPTGSDDDGDKL